MAFHVKREHGLLRDFWLPVLSFVLVICLVILGVNRTAKSTDEQMYEAARSSVMRCVAECYALEGAYPPSVAYLKENYGLTVDESRYVIHYRSLGGNLLPEIRVLPLEGGDRP